MTTEQTQALIENGKRAFENNDLKQARTCLEAVVKGGRRYADLLNLLGVIYHQEGQFNKALEAFGEALKINPDYLEANLNLAVLYNDLGQYAQARKLYKRLGKRSKQAPIDPILNGKLSNQHAVLGQTYFRLGRYDEAIDEFRKALVSNPKYADIRTHLALALRETGDLAASIKELRCACRDKPKYHEARVQLGLSLYIKGQKKAATLEWQRILKQNPKHTKAQMYLEMNP